MSFISNVIMKFEEYEVDRARWRLSWRGEPLPLNRKTFDLLLYLMDHADKVVGKEEVLRALWPESFVEESNLTQHVFLLRKALSRHSSGQKIIETIPGRGYRFAPTIHAHEIPPSPTGMVSKTDPSTTRIAPEEGAVDDPAPAIPAPVPDGALPTETGLPPRSRFRRHPYLWTTLPFSLALIAAYLVTLGPLRRPSRLRVLDAVRLTNDGVTKHLARSETAVVSDGSRLIFTEKRDNQSVVAEVPLDGGEVRSRPAPFAEAAIASYSAVNRSLLFGSAWRTDDDQPIFAETPPGSKPMQVGELTGHDASWSPDGLRIALAKGRFLYIADADGSNQHRLVSAGGIIYAPRWSPDGRTLSFSENLGSNENYLWEVSSTGTNLHRLFTDQADGGHVCCGTWSADGRNFFYLVQGIVSNSIWVLPRSQSYFPFSRPVPIQLTLGLADVWQIPEPAPDGKALWAVGSHLRGELTIVDPVTRRLHPFLGGLSAEGVSFSPDRSWIVYTSYPDGTLWRSHADGTEKQQLTQAPLVARFPQWSPDGNTIAFMGSHSGAAWRIYLIPASGGPPRPMIEDNTTQGVPSWSPDGKQIAFGRLLDFGNERDPNLTIEFYDLERHSHKTLHGSEGMWTARWSPNGRFLSAVTQDNRVLRLYDMKTQEWTDLADVGVNDVIWSRDSRYIYFDTLFGGDPTLYRISIDTRKLERWADLRGFPLGGFYDPWLGITPDGSPLLVKETSIEEIYRLDLGTSD
jgi:Tol biopolymer transport system component/DNA-binding winged helix-turn-helix (wHTH) protein